MLKTPIYAIVWDLDDTLLDTTGLLIPIRNSPEFAQRINQPLPLMDGALANLKWLLPLCPQYLLTQGREDYQRAKINSLKIAHFFEDIFIVDPNGSETKGHYFAKLKNELELADQELLSIGNRRSTDISMAKKVGYQTLLFDYGEHTSEVASCEEEIPDEIITSHFQLRGVLKL